MQITTRGSIAVLGGGIAGLSTALGRRGWEVRVFERAVARQPAGFGFVLPERSVDALEVLAPGLTLGFVGRAIDVFELRDLGGTLVHVAPLPRALGITRTDLGAPTPPAPGRRPGPRCPAVTRRPPETPTTAPA